MFVSKVLLAAIALLAVSYLFSLESLFEVALPFFKITLLIWAVINTYKKSQRLSTKEGWEAENEFNPAYHIMKEIIPENRGTLVLLALVCLIFGTYILHRALDPHSFSLVFRMINFASLFAVGFYLFKTHGATIIQEKIEERKQLLARLEQEKTVWQHEQETIQRNTARQETETDYLKERVFIWRAAFAHQQAERQREKMQLQEALRRKKIVQGNRADLDDARKRVLAVAVQSARKDLQKEFSSPQAHDQFMNAVLTYMNKEAQ